MPRPTPAPASARQAASSQFARAEEQRAALNLKPSSKRTLNDYKLVVGSYRRVYLITPHASEVPDSLVAVAELYTEMGDRFGRPYYQSAVDSYEFLIREYPTSRFAPDAYLRSGRLQKDQLGDLAGATKTYDAFLKKFPHSRQRREAQEARAELALLQRATSPSAPDLSKSAVARSAGSDDGKGSRPPVVSRDVPRDVPSGERAKQPAETAQDIEEDDGPPAAGFGYDSPGPEDRRESGRGLHRGHHRPRRQRAVRPPAGWRTPTASILICMRPGSLSRSCTRRFWRRAR
jgi:tetratricopeptide (TPR) repeat protein